MLSVLMLCSFSIPPIAVTASCASVRAVGAAEHAVKAKMETTIPTNRFGIDIVLLLFVDECVERDYQNFISGKQRGPQKGTKEHTKIENLSTLCFAGLAFTSPELFRRAATTAFHCVRKPLHR